MRPGGKFNLKYKFSDAFNVNFSIGYQQLGAKKNFRSEFLNFDLDLEYLVLPFNEFSPFLYGGIGLINNTKGVDKRLKFKTQFGGGLEYLISPNIGFRGFGAYHIGVDDDWDRLVSGKRDDHFLQIGFGIHYYFN